MKKVQKLWKFFDYFRDHFSSSSYRNLIELLYVLYVWKKKKLSKATSFSEFYRGEISAVSLEKHLQQMTKQETLFDLYLDSGFYFVKSLNTKDLVFICSFLEENEDLPAFLNSIGMLIENVKFYDNAFVPKELVELSFGLLDKRVRTVYSPMTTSLNLLERQPEKSFFMEVEERNYRTLLQLAKEVDKVDLHYKINNPLQKPAFVNNKASHLLSKFDAGICFPSFGLKIRNKSFVKNDVFNRFKFYEGKGGIEIPIIEHLLAQVEFQTIVIVPGSFLFKSGKEKDFRKFLIDNMKIEAIFQLPANLFSHTSIETALLVLNNQKKYEDVLLVNLNLEKFFSNQKRKNVLTKIDDAVKLFKERIELEGVSKKVSKAEFENNNFSFAIDRYVLDKETSEMIKLMNQFPTVKLSEIAEIRRAQTLRTFEDGEKFIEVSPSDLPESGFIKAIGKEKLIDSNSKQFKTYSVKRNDVVLSTKGSVGKVGIVGEQSNFIVSQAFHILRPKGGLEEAKYLYLLLKSKLGQMPLQRLASGSVMPQIPANALENMKIPWPTAKKQKKLIQDFEKEIKINNEIEQLKVKLNALYENFLNE